LYYLNQNNLIFDKFKLFTFEEDAFYSIE